MGDQPKFDELLPKLGDQSPSLLITLALNEGDPCPHCSKGQLGYNGLLNLVCGHCGFEMGGAHT